MVECGQWGKGNDRLLLAALFCSGKVQESDVLWHQLVPDRTAAQVTTLCSAILQFTRLLHIVVNACCVYDLYQWAPSYFSVPFSGDACEWTSVLCSWLIIGHVAKLEVIRWMMLQCCLILHVAMMDSGACGFIIVTIITALMEA